MVWTQPNKCGKGGKRDLLFEVFIDVARDDSLLPRSKPSLEGMLTTRNIAAETQEFVRQNRSKSFTIKSIGPLGIID